MTGMTTRSQPLLVVENKTFGNRAYCAINEGLGKVMRFGGNDAEVLDRLRDAALDRAGARARARPRAARGRRHCAQAPDRARAHDGRRDASAQCRVLEPAAACARARARPHRAEHGRARGVPRLHRPQRSVLPQCRDGDGKGAHRSGARHRGLDRRHRHEPERHRLRHPRVRHRRPLVHGAGRDAGRALFPGLQRKGRQSRHGRFGDRRNHRPRRLRDGGSARRGRLYGRGPRLAGRRVHAVALRRAAHRRPP